MKTKSKFIRCLCSSAILGLAAVTMPAMGQIPVDLFELDENTANNGNPDWEDTEGAVFSGIVPDPLNRTFKKGSKDTKDVSTWHWDFFNTVTPKDDIQNAYAAYLKATSGDDILYFGLDRLSGSSSGGTTSFGFWAFQDAVSLIDPTKATSDMLDGEHKDGDIFIAGDMSGNTIDELRVYIWEGDGTAGSLVEITAQASITPHCGDASLINGGDDYDTDACGEINTAPFSPDWITGDIEPGRFIEVGLNYTELVGPLPCFNTFMATTRTSDSETASTKNFVLGGFPVCSIDVAKVCATTELVDPFIPTYRTEFLATVENDGGAQFSDTAVVTVIDAGADQTFDTADDIIVVRTVGDLTTPDDGSDGFQSGEFLDVPESGMVITGSYVSTDNGGMNKVKASISDGPLNVSSGIYTADCDDLQLTPALYIEKECSNILLTALDLSENPLSHVGIKVDYDIVACNTGQFPLDVDLADPTAGVDDSGIILAAGLACDDVVDGFDACPAGSHCVGYDNTAPLVPGVCVTDGSEENGPDGDGGSVQVCVQTDGTYLLEELAGAVNTQTPLEAIFSNTATVSADDADNPLLVSDIMESATAACPLCPVEEE